MKSNYKLLSALFILIMFISLIYTSTGVLGETNEATESVRSNVTTDVAGDPASQDFNASISYAERNITITSTSRVVLEDHFTLKIHDNKTFIESFNFTVPTVFDKYVISSEIYAKHSASLIGLQAEKNKKEATKFIGEEATTYTFPITENGTLANETVNVQIFVRLVATDAIAFEGIDDFQRGRVTVPLSPVFPNLSLDNSLVGMIISSQQNSFNRDEMGKISTKNGDFPILREKNLLEWRNLTRDAFNPLEGLTKDYDYTELVIDSKQPDLDANLDETPSIASFVFTQADRRLKIDPWGFVYVTETLTMKNLGAPRLENPEDLNLNHQILGFDLQVPGFAKVTKLYDDMGRLNVGELDTKDFTPTTSETGGISVLQVNFRNSIYGGEEYTFTVEYRMNATNVISIDENKVYSLNTTLFSVFNATVYKMNTVYELPAGSKLISNGFRSNSPKSLVEISNSLEYSTLSYFKHVELVISITNASYIDNNQFVIQYKYNGLGHIQYVLTFIMTLIILLLSVFAISNIKFAESKSIEIEKERIPIDEIEAFLNYFTEQSDANRRISELTNKRRKNKIPKRDYTGKVKAIRKRIRENNPLLESSIKKLSTIGSKYERLVSKIMIANQKISDVNSNISNTRKSYSKKEITKDIYQKLMREYRIENDKQESIVNRSLSELRDIVQ